MDSKYIDWVLDIKPSRWCLYANAFNIEKEAGSKQTFEEFLYECFKRETK